MTYLRRHTLHLLIGLMTAFVAVLATTDRASAAEPGVVPDLTWYTSDADKARTVAALQDVGSKWVRLNVQWKEAEPQKNNYDAWWIAEYAKAVTMAKAAGQKVIVMVDSAPAWASGSGSSNVPRDPADYADFMRFLAGKLPGVDAYEVWNEPNLQRFWSTGPDAGEYTRLLQAAYPAIKSAAPGAQVVFGGLSGNDYGFVEKAYAAGAKGSFDVMAVHPYTYCGSTGPADIRRETNGRISRDSFFGYREVRASMAAQGDAKPIWFTEFGWTTSTAGCDPGAGMWQGGVSEAKQADHLYEAFKLMEQDSYVEVALWYDFRNNYWMNDEDTAEARYGLLNTDFSPKPAYGAFKAYAHGTTYTPSSGSSGGSTGSGDAEVTTATKLKVQVKSKTRQARVLGKVSAASGGSVLLDVERLRGKRWGKVGSYRLNLRGNAFQRRLNRLPAGSIRVRASYSGVEGAAAGSRSRFVRFSLG